MLAATGIYDTGGSIGGGRAGDGDYASLGETLLSALNRLFDEVGGDPPSAE